MKTSTFIRRAVKDHLGPVELYTPLGQIRSPFLCVALDLYAQEHGTPQAHKIRAQAQEKIMRLICPHVTAAQWLRERLGWCSAKCHPSAEALYEYRLRWAEDLAQQYEAQGD